MEPERLRLISALEENSLQCACVKLKDGTTLTIGCGCQCRDGITEPQSGGLDDTHSSPAGNSLAKNHVLSIR